MLSELQIFGLQSAIPSLPLDGGSPGTDPIQIKNIDGVEPVKAAITTSPYGAYDGESYTGSSVGKRNIVLTVGLNPDWEDQTIESLRNLLYAYFMPKTPVRLRFTRTDLPQCEIDGICESIEPNIFSKDPEMQVSIICPDPYFIAVDETTVTHTVGDGTTSSDVDYEGNVPVGFKLKVTSNLALVTYAGPLIVSVSSVGTQVSMITNIGVDAANRFEMSTVSGDKYARQVRVSDGVYGSILAKVAKPRVWPILFPGVNKVSLGATSSGQNWIMSYFARFGGL